MHWYLDPIVKHYADFNGRASRQEYWMFTLFNFIISIGVSLISQLMQVPVLSTVYTLVVLVPVIALTTRRYHDIGKSGWWQLILLIPLIGAILVLLDMIKAGEAGQNAYGKDPKDADDDQTNSTVSTPQEQPAEQPAPEMTSESAPAEENTQ